VTSVLDMEIAALGIDEGLGQPLLLLREVGGEHRVLPVWIGDPEAGAIDVEMRRAANPRMVHRLIGEVVAAFDRRIEQVTLVGLKDELMLAELVVDSGVTVPCRVSDAVAIALHLRVPIRAADELLEQASVRDSRVGLGGPGRAARAEPGGADTSGPVTLEEIRRFRDSLDTATPDDFA
jgi:uncharacterized protein